jgi:hypothetical protein
MNASVEKILRDFETTHAFGAVELIFGNGQVVMVHIKRTLKMTSGEPNTQRENRGNNHVQGIENTSNR